MKSIRLASSAARQVRNAPRPLVLVPTMGALHAGHLALIDRARREAGGSGTVAVSIFVNPTQFGPAEDFSRYPRPIARDTALCREHGADVLFAPEAAEMYPPDFSTFVEETKLETVLCGRSRPGHFRGVCTVVAKLFNLLAPDAAVFGEKDYQQLAIVRRMVRDLHFPIKILPVKTVREPDGLALSSRNQYLSAAEREQAPAIRRGLLAAAAAAKAETRDSAALVRTVRETISFSAPLARIDYIEAVDAETLAPAGPQTERTVIAAAVFFGRTRLIDNIALPRRRAGRGRSASRR